MSPTSDNPPLANPGGRSFVDAVTEHPVIVVVSLLAGAALLAGALAAIGTWADSDEAPIRVKNGSLDMQIMSAGQEWQASGSSGNWTVRNGALSRDQYDVTVASRTGATCGPSVTATGGDIVFTYQTDSGPKEIRLQAASRKTTVKPGNGVTMTLVNPQLLSYRPSGTGYLKQIAVGSGANPAVLCSFTGPAQLDHVLVLNVP
jgi:hypothetical protein